MTVDSLLPMTPTGPLPVPPEDHVLFRLTQLLLLMSEVAGPNDLGLGLERLGFYEFFSANPFVVIGEDEPQARAELHLAGFDERLLSYAATGHRFANRRRRLQHDMALLVAYGLVNLHGAGWRLTPLGLNTARQMTALYAQQYLIGVRLIVRRLARLRSDTALAKQAREWLREPALILDLYGANYADEPDVGEPYITDPDSPRSSASTHEETRDA